MEQEQMNEGFMVAMMEPVEGAEGRREGMKHTQQVFGPSMEQQRI